MADMSQVNLERLRATDAMWEETKHPRADNGQFTSGSGGGGAKVTKATPGMTGGKFQTREQAVNRAIEQHSPKMNAALKGIKKAEKEEADMESKYYRGFNRLNKMGKTDLGYDLLERFDEKRKVPQMKRQQQLSKYNRALGKEMDQINNITKTFQAAGKTLAKARPGIAKMREQAKVVQPAAKPQASHPMANEVQRDIDYWHQMQYGGRPSEKQKQDTIESMRMQYDDYLKTAEKNWKLAQSVPNLDEATRNKYKQKYETAKGKVEALKEFMGE